MFKCSLCLDHADEFAALPCGHVYCHRCLLIQIERYKQCPQCRNAYDIPHIIRLYVDEQDSQSRPHHPPAPSVRNALSKVNELAAKANEITVESPPSEIEALVIGCERVMMRFQVEGGSAAEESLKELERCLVSLRGRLKYAARLDSAKEQNKQSAATIQDQEARIRRLISERAAALVGRDEAMKSIKLLEQKEGLMREKYDRLKMRFTKHHERDNNNQNAQFSQVLELQEQLRKCKIESTKYKKRYLVARQRAARAGVAPLSNTQPYLASSDEELEILPPDATCELTQPGNVTLRRKDKLTHTLRKEEGSDVLMDSDDSSRHDPYEVEGIL